MRAWAGLAGLAVLLLFAGCAEKPDDCSDGEDFNPHEERCVDGTEPDAEVCHAWLSGSARDAGPLSCQARSDGKAWLDSSLTTSDPFRLEVRDGGGATVYSREVQFGGSIELKGKAGAWTLEVDFGDAAGSGRLVLWG